MIEDHVVFVGSTFFTSVFDDEDTAAEDWLVEVFADTKFFSFLCGVGRLFGYAGQLVATDD